MDWWVIVLGLSVLVVVGKLFLSSLFGKRMNAAVKKDPLLMAAQKIVRESGRYDGSPQARRKAQLVLDGARLGLWRTDSLEQFYWKTLEETDLPILLVLLYTVVYTVVVSTMIDMPSENASSLRAEANSPESRIIQAAMISLFPEYDYFVSRRNPGIARQVILSRTFDHLLMYMDQNHPEINSMITKAAGDTVGQEN